MSDDAPDDLARRVERARLCAERELHGRAAEDGGWRGRLSSSALATAVAALAWTRSAQPQGAPHAARAIDWLARNGNPDGGWGDTPASPSNLATTLLCRAAIHAYLRPLLASRDTGANAGGDGRAAEGAGATARELCSCLASAEAWVLARSGSLEPKDVVAAVMRTYGRDRTFSVPILTHCALAGTLGDDPWRLVPQLPLELAILPHRFFRLIRLPVVSYALPALIAIGLVRHVLAGGAGLRGRLRTALLPALLRKLQRLQPQGGGYLEAAPLTGFVAMSLTAAGYGGHPVVREGLAFLRRGQRADGALAIDSDLSVWLTSHAARVVADRLPLPRRQELLGWLLQQQQTRVHPYTAAAPGGWAWTDLPGGVPDADDTAGALLALRALTADAANRPEQVVAAAEQGVDWLLGLQNRDGGIPTFCRGWGALPFDRSCPDLSAHALQAFAEWRASMPARVVRLTSAIGRVLTYLRRSQNADGSWLPLWFGNQNAPGQQNPVFGTAQVCLALRAALAHLAGDAQEERARRLLTAGEAYLAGCQNVDGGWGGSAGVISSVEESALALAALAGAPTVSQEHCAALGRGTEWLLRATADGTVFPASAIGLYFSALWYDEALYPLIFTLRALRAVAARFAAEEAR